LVELTDRCIPWPRLARKECFFSDGGLTWHRLARLGERPWRQKRAPRKMRP